LALTNVTLPYVMKIANLGWEKACESNKDLSKGLNIVQGEIVYNGITL
jgi:alanine dehydrogenase